MRLRLLGCLTALACLSNPLHAREQSTIPARPREPYRLIFTSSTLCQDPGEFTRQLSSRTSRLQAAVGAEPAVTVLVDLAPAPDQVRGQLVIRAADGSLAVREVPGVDCHEVLEAMALIVALEVDNRTALSAGLPRPERSAPSTPSLAIGARLLATSGVVPGLSPGLGVYGEVTLPRAGLVSPSFRLTGHRTESTEQVDSVASSPGREASAEFELIAARFSGCPLRWSPRRLLTFRPCALVELGQLRARGYNVVDEEPARALLWSAAGVELAVEIMPVGPLTLGAEAGMLFPLLRDAFYFDPEGQQAQVHKVGPVGFIAAVGAGLRLF